MGERGPIPKRSESRQRRNTPASSITKAPGADRVIIPAANKEWHPIATRLWRSLAKSGQSKFYEPSDWALAYSLMDDLSYYKFATKRSGQMLASIMASLSTLLLTEGDRRRVSMELSRPTAEQLESEGVTEMKQWQERLAAPGTPAKRSV
jgi:hypothetical protein